MTLNAHKDKKCQHTNNNDTYFSIVLFPTDVTW